MINHRQLVFWLLLTLPLSACDTKDSTEQYSETTDPLVSSNADSSTNNTQHSKKFDKPHLSAKFKTIEWIDLMPKEDFDALLNPPSYVTDIEDGSAEDRVTSIIKNTIAAASDDRYQQALVSTDIVSEMDGQAIRLPGFVVPLEFNDDQTISQFFLVPFFGACIHSPPPPPNQIVFVDYPQGLKLTALQDPLWISGVVKASLIENELATAAYSLTMQSFEQYVQ